MAMALFYKPTCGFSRRVIQYMEQNGIDIPRKNVSESPEFRNELVALSGKAQVPCLVVDGTPIFESADIIEWLAEHWSGYDHKGD